MRAKGFYFWLCKQSSRDGHIGDLGEGVKRDIGSTNAFETLQEWENHLLFRGADAMVISALKDAWLEYSNL